jgi:hypothetical protein
MSELLGNFSYVPETIPYAHEGLDTSESPFAVAVLGLGNENLGIGRIIGKSKDGRLLPVVVIDDPNMPGGSVALSGDQCYWACLGDDQEAIIDDFIEHQDEFMPVSEYIEILGQGLSQTSSGGCYRHSQIH